MCGERSCLTRRARTERLPIAQCRVNLHGRIAIRVWRNIVSKRGPIPAIGCRRRDATLSPTSKISNSNEGAHTHLKRLGERFTAINDQEQREKKRQRQRDQHLSASEKRNKSGIKIVVLFATTTRRKQAHTATNKNNSRIILARKTSQPRKQHPARRMLSKKKKNSADRSCHHLTLEKRFECRSSFRY